MTEAPEPVALEEIGGLASYDRLASRRGKVTLLPDPTPRERKYTIISVDDHLVEPPTMFEGRLPKKFQDLAPKMVEAEDGSQAWHFDGHEFPNVGFNALAGRPVDEHSMEPARFDEMRKGCWDVKERVRDMDLNGIQASVNFPSFLAGFAGQKFANARDPELGLAVLRAWNDWHIEAWAGAFPDRLIPCQLTWLRDPVVAAGEIRRNAERGFKAVSFVELPSKLGLPSLHSRYWDPFVEACAETETVICLHIGSSSQLLETSEDAPPETIAALSPYNAMLAAVDWLYSGIPLKFPSVKIALSEGGIGWIPGLLDRLDFNTKHHAYGQGWTDKDLLPTEVLHRNFWYCSIYDPTGFRMRDRIGVDRIMVEVDYPHASSTWPDSQSVTESNLAGCSDHEVRMITYENASKLFRHPVPVSSSAS